MVFRSQRERQHILAVVRPMLGICCILAAFCSRAEADTARTRIVQRWRAPDGSMEVIWAAPDKLDGSTDQYALILTRQHRLSATVARFGRAVDVYWSPDSQHIAVTDHIGSNISDCFVVDAARPIARILMSEALPRLSETPERAHFYVACNGWRGPDQVIVRVDGHTDFAPSRKFVYRFLYSLQERQILSVPDVNSNRSH